MGRLGWQWEPRLHVLPCGRRPVDGCRAAAAAVAATAATAAATAAAARDQRVARHGRRSAGLFFDADTFPVVVGRHRSARRPRCRCRCCCPFLFDPRRTLLLMQPVPEVVER